MTSRIEIIGNSVALKKVVSDAERLKQLRGDNRILLLGETGVGKDLIAQLIHRGNGEYVAVNCAGIPQDLLQSELFGHVKGAFTGSIGSEGQLGRANGGLLFLDELGSVAVGFHNALLRVFQNGEYVPVGGTKILPFHGDIVAATGSKHGEKGGLPEDLWHRFRWKLRVPALRERAEDIPALAKHFAKLAKAEYDLKLASNIFPPQLMQALQAYHWPGNIRQLQNVIYELVVFCLGDNGRIDIGKARERADILEIFGDSNQGVSRLQITDGKFKGMTREQVLFSIGLQESITLFRVLIAKERVGEEDNLVSFALKMGRGYTEGQGQAMLRRAEVGTLVDLKKLDLMEYLEKKYTPQRGINDLKDQTNPFQEQHLEELFAMDCEEGILMLRRMRLAFEFANTDNPQYLQSRMGIAQTAYTTLIQDVCKGDLSNINEFIQLVSEGRSLQESIS